MDKISSMRAFCRVVELGSFVAAAKDLNISGTMVSKHIAYLEKLLGVSLFNRTTRVVSQTEIGREYYLRCNQLLHDLIELEDTVTGMTHLPSGLLKINAPVDFGGKHMAAVIAGFQSEYPDVRILLSLDNHYVDLNQGIFDIAIRVTDTPDQDLIAKPIASTKLCTFAAPTYLDQYGRPESIEDLSSHRCLRFLGTPHGDEWLFECANTLKTFSTNWYFSSNNGGLLCEVASLGVGIIQVPHLTAAAYAKSGALTELLPQCRLSSLPVYAIYTQRKYPSLKIKSFISFSTSYFKQHELN